MPWTTPGTYSSVGQSGYLATLGLTAQAGASSPPGYTLLVNVRSINPDYGKTPNIDISTLQSPSNTQELYPGMIKPGPLELECVFSADTTQTQIYTWQKAQTILLWELTSGIKQYASTYVAAGVGYVIAYSPTPFENDKEIGLKVTIQITGPVAETLNGVSV